MSPLRTQELQQTGTNDERSPMLRRHHQPPSAANEPFSVFSVISSAIILPTLQNFSSIYRNTLLDSRKRCAEGA